MLVCVCVCMGLHGREREGRRNLVNMQFVGIHVHKDNRITLLFGPRAHQVPDGFARLFLQDGPQILCFCICICIFLYIQSQCFLQEQEKEKEKEKQSRGKIKTKYFPIWHGQLRHLQQRLIVIVTAHYHHTSVQK